MKGALVVLGEGQKERKKQRQKETQNQRHQTEQIMNARTNERKKNITKERRRGREREREAQVDPPTSLWGGRSRAALRACCWEQQVCRVDVPSSGGRLEPSLKPPAHSGPRRSLASRVCATKRSTATGSITSPRRFCRGGTSNGDYHSVVIESYLGNTASKDFLVEMSKAGEDPRPPNAGAKALRPAGRTPSKKQRIARPGGNPRLDPDVGQRHKGQTPRPSTRSPTCATGPGTSRRSST